VTAWRRRGGCRTTFSRSRMNSISGTTWAPSMRLSLETSSSRRPTTSATETSSCVLNYPPAPMPSPQKKRYVSPQPHLLSNRQKCLQAHSLKETDTYISQCLVSIFKYPSIEQPRTLQPFLHTTCGNWPAQIYRSYIELGDYDVVQDQVKEDAQTALQAVKLLSTFKSKPVRVC